MRSKTIDIVVIAMIIISVGCYLYSPLSKFINENAALQAVSDFDKAIAEKSEKQKKQELQAARRYNQNPKFKEYGSILNTKDGMMGYIEIPKINVKLPIYHGTDKATLENGIGHLKNSSLPIGGKNTHAVLTGHTGLPSAKFFDDIGMLKVNDCFQMIILDEKLTYKVTRIKTVLPDRSAKLLSIQPNKDLITLITCTPYGINSQRLLITGERTSDKIKNKVQAAAHSAKENLIFRITAAITTASVLIFITVKPRKQNRKKLSHNKTTST